jgi:hypothetical protein
MYGGGGSSGHSDTFRRAVIDTLVAEVQSTIGEDRAVLLLVSQPLISVTHVADGAAGIQAPDGGDVPGTPWIISSTSTTFSLTSLCRTSILG